MKITGFAEDTLFQSNLMGKKNKIEDESSFSGYLQEKLDGVNKLQMRAEESTEALIKGEDIDIHQVLLNTEEAQLSLQLAIEIRNKMVEAYQEINRLQL
ncbi:MAG: flagellar hook-basal body complex protein FliE [Clostridiaceae bacterium]